MEYGSSILSKIPADWTVVGGTITSSSIFLGVGGSATLEILPKDIKMIPNTMQLYILASRYDNAYAPGTFAVLRVVSEEDITYEYSVPIAATLPDICTTILQTSSMKYKKCYFVLRAEQPITITEWLLSPPVVEEQVPIDLDDLKKEIPKLLADYNVAPITVGHKEVTLALISFMLTSNTDISGHLQVSFYASHDAVVTLRFVDNDGIELFAPIHRLVQNGYNTVGVPHSYLKRKLGIHTFIVSAQVSVGTLTFGIRDVLFTIDAGYLASRTMDVGLDLQDIALCQLVGEDEPSSIYAIGIDEDGIARVRSRVYSTDASIIWQPRFSLPSASKAAIEFDGTFIRRTGDEFFTLECEDTPWVFWVNPAGQLLAHKGPVVEPSVPVVLTEGPVTDLSVVRGYKSTLFPQQDQGVICTYIIGGKVYYRNFARLPNETYGWDEQQELTQLGTNVTSIQVHRLNDFRVGFASTSTLGNKWLISDRTYVAASVPTETVYFSTQVKSLIAIKDPATADDPIPYEITMSNDGYRMNIDLAGADWVIGAYFNLYFTYDATMDFNVDTVEVSGSRLSLNLLSPVEYGTVNLYPIPGEVVVYKHNEGKIPLTDTLTYIKYNYKYGYETETVSMSAQVQSTIEMIYSGPIEHKHTDIVLFSVAVDSSVELIAVEVTDMLHDDHVDIGAVIDSEVKQIHISDIPI